MCVFLVGEGGSCTLESGEHDVWRESRTTESSRSLERLVGGSTMESSRLQFVLQRTREQGHGIRHHLSRSQTERTDIRTSVRVMLYPSLALKALLKYFVWTCHIYTPNYINSEDLHEIEFVNMRLSN